ncbi:MAG: molybdenum cofactor guanylyltransferase [Methanobrevibacter ruminantium]|uniref:molybdenum cofactor guanylyltransferase n=1 Tax=Methanobrevibacter ruminantium TaxID=83816 RepID=UPI0026F2B43A|nr:molybdenum cofactor guanylyltransferase [Methanobrevibacter ruminantium]MCI5736898.1 molybdenum cofactor guanylyltransferase [Methanobrevibacter ruminantium]MDD6049247.1 molybdenum cofactor guanylyltransferase [Methanobrevibacter ruminantium]MDO5842832.1 molybdenum cofactor guanylyltransferase [Methanobrevibacter ruminantium]
MNGQKLYSCIVLSGGMSRRMGQDKGSMIIKEKPMILHILERLNYKINDATIVLNDAQRIADYQSLLNQYCDDDIEDNFDYSLNFVEDEIKGKGPISGIMTGLKNIKTDYALVLPCDSPFISEENIDAMFKLLDENLESDIDAIIPFHIKSNKDKFKDNDEFNFDDASEMTVDMKIANSEPLHAIYKKENLNKIDELLKEDNLYVKSFIKGLKNPCFIEVDNRVLFEKDFRNFNRKEDLDDLE